MSFVNWARADSRAAFLALCLLTASSANAAVLLSETFTGVTLTHGANINLVTASTSDDNLGKWLDSSTIRWSVIPAGSSDCAAPCAGSFAQHLVQSSENGNLLFYGLSGASVSVGDQLVLSFDFIRQWSTNPTTGAQASSYGRAYLVGMTYGLHDLDPAAPWFGGGDTNDGVVLASSGTLTSATWKSATPLIHNVTTAYDVYVVGFIMDGTNGLRGVDNVVLERTPSQIAPLPEPTTIALLAGGLLGLAAARRRKQ